MNDEQFEKGVAQFAKMVGDDKIDALRARFSDLSPDFERAVMGVVGGEIWSRPNLDLRTRSLVSIGVLAAQGRVSALELNVQMALVNGATKDEIVEVFFQVAAYAGFAAAWDGLQMAMKVINEHEGNPGRETE